MTTIYRKAVVEEVQIAGYSCNMCGKDINHYDTKCQALIDHGYDSGRDGNVEEFHMCLECYYTLEKTFKIEPRICSSPFFEFDDETVEA